MGAYGRCDVQGCRKAAVLVYLGKDVCEKHWERHCNDNSRFDLREALKISKRRMA